MGINENFRYLSIGLPGDVERCKQHGDFERALRLIDRRLSGADGEVPEALKRCLTVERELISRLGGDYPYSRAEALDVIRADIPEFTMAEFDELVDGARIDWIYIGGEERFFNRFYATLIKTDAAFAARTGKSRGHVDGEEDEENGETEENGEKEKALLDATIAEMKQNGSVSYSFRMRASARIEEGSFKPGFVRVHLPIPAAARQTSDIRLIAFSGEPTAIAPQDAPQRTVCFEEDIKENHEFFVEYAYTNTNRYVDAYNAVASAAQQNLTCEFDEFLAQEQPHIVFTPYIKELVRTMAGHTDDPIAKARIFYDFITNNVKYSYMRKYFGLENIAENCARQLRGDCGVQALLFITLCRCAGVPARWQSALAASPTFVGAHDWAEFYVAPYGWLFADPSYGGGAVRAGAEERRRFYFGNLDPFRMVANRAFQADLLPDKAHWRADPYDNQTGEIEYLDRGLEHDEYAREQVMLECRKL